MNKYLYIVVIVVSFVVFMAFLFVEYQISTLEKVAFAFITSLVIGYLFRLKTNTEDTITKLLKAEKISRVGFWSLDFTDDKLFWSDEIFDIFEINSKEFQPSYENFLNTIHPDDRDSFLANWQN